MNFTFTPFAPTLQNSKISFKQSFYTTNTLYIYMKIIIMATKLENLQIYSESVFGATKEELETQTQTLIDNFISNNPSSVVDDISFPIMAAELDGNELVAGQLLILFHEGDAMNLAPKVFISKASSLEEANDLVSARIDEYFETQGDKELISHSVSFAAEINGSDYYVAHIFALTA